MFLNLKMYLALAVAIAFAGAVGFGVLMWGKWKAEQVHTVALETTVAVQNTTIEQKQQNQKASKKASQGRQQDEEQIAPIEQAINQLEGPRYFNEDESRVVRDLVSYWNCGGVQPFSADCGQDGRLLRPADETALVSIDSTLEAVAEAFRYAHELERTVKCYEDSMSGEK